MANQLRRQRDLIGRDAPKLKRIKDVFTIGFQRDVVRRSSVKDIPRRRVDMIYDQIQIPLSKETEILSLGENIAEHGMRLLDSTLLTAAHRITVIVCPMLTG